ncbi:MAG: ATP-grasp domain-containing protein [Gammaproteobacteria bacterium]|nr:ATP-grasp domain-containing protein [Gammaproteobacteria bacterium]
MKYLLVVEKSKDWKDEFPQVTVVTAKEYIKGDDALSKRGLRVINLCRSYSYLSIGYYVSLLAEARGQKAQPSVQTLTDLSRKSIYSMEVDFINSEIDKAIRKHQVSAYATGIELDIIFGLCHPPDLRDLAHSIFEIFPCPFLRVEFRKTNIWQIRSIRPMYLNNLNAEQLALFTTYFNSYMGRRWNKPRTRWVSKYDLAILYNPQEKLAPSNKGALNKFISMGKKLGIDVELIEKKDLDSLAEYDGLLIRETTAIEHYTYTFAKKAQAEGMVVIDDPVSILKCTNKVYLTELLTTQRIPIPKTMILTEKDFKLAEDTLQFPLVLKIPDGAFSRGIYKAENLDQAREYAKILFKDSDIILIQEYMYTEFDWRVGVLANKPLFVCQYFMSKAHWQIVKHESNGKAIEGTFKAWRLEDVDPKIINIALKAASAIGDGLYGVDLKQNDKGIYVMEVNDNPNIDAGVEDTILGDELYTRILEEFVRRWEMRRSV